jgi:hypothetical protein
LYELGQGLEAGLTPFEAMLPNSTGLLVAGVCSLVNWRGGEGLRVRGSSRLVVALPRTLVSPLRRQYPFARPRAVIVSLARSMISAVCSSTPRVATPSGSWLSSWTSRFCTPHFTRSFAVIYPGESVRS